MASGSDAAGERRKLHFNSLGEIVADADAPAAAEKAGELHLSFPRVD